MAGRPQRILYYETSAYAPSSAHFLEAFGEAGLEHRFFDEAVFSIRLRRSLLQRLAHRLLGRRPLFSLELNRAFQAAAESYRPDVILVTKGSWLRPATLRAVRARGAYLVNFATDDPFNPANTSADLVAAIPEYDLYLSTKRAIVGDLAQAGARRVEFLPFGYKPAVHFPEAPASEAERTRFSSDVAFIGGADADRVPLLEHLARVPGIRLALYGGGWERWPQLRAHARGFVYGRDYRLAVSGARVNLGLVRRANRDGHAMRTFEIPACGGCVLAEDTAEHREFFPGPDEYDFFPTDAEAPARLQALLADEARCARLAAGARRRLLAGKHTYADRLRQMLAMIPNRS